MVTSSDRLIIRVIRVRGARVRRGIVPYQRRLKMLWLTSNANIAVPISSCAKFPSQP